MRSRTATCRIAWEPLDRDPRRTVVRQLFDQEFCRPFRAPIVLSYDPEYLSDLSCVPASVAAFQM